MTRKSVGKGVVCPRRGAALRLQTAGPPLATGELSGVGYE